MIPRTCCLSAMILVVLLMPCQGLHEKTGKIKTLLTGRVTDRHLISSWFLNEPMVSPLFVPSRDVPGGDAEIRKFVRIYFPRTYEGVQVQDFMLFCGTIMNMFSPLQQRWMHDAVVDGTGGVNSRSLLSGIYYPEWAASQTQKAFPNDAEAVMASGAMFRSDKEVLIVLEEESGLPPVLTMFKDKNVQWHLTGYSCGLVIPRQGAKVWSWIRGPFADMATDKPGCTPHVISWQYGKGITWTTHDRLVNWWQDPVANPYGLDMIMNMILYSTGRNLPEDVELVHDIRSRIVEFKTRQLLVLAVVEFGESFGASMDPVLRELGRIVDRRREADELYLMQEYLQSRAAYVNAIANLEELSLDAMERKDRAMLWVYLVQWFTVSGTSMFAGFLLWSLMVRRRLYRQVKVTRFAGW